MTNITRGIPRKITQPSRNEVDSSSTKNEISTAKKNLGVGSINRPLGEAKSQETTGNIRPPSTPDAFAQQQLIKDIGKTADNIMSSSLSSTDKRDALQGFAESITDSKLSPFMKQHALREIGAMSSQFIANPRDKMDFQQSFFDSFANDSIRNAKPEPDAKYTGMTKKEAATMLYDSYRKQAGF